MNISRFKNQFKLYYVGLALLCCVGATCVCGAAVSQQTQENDVARSGVLLKPGTVNIGTRSSGYHPVVLTQPDAPAVPMISGNTVRRYAHGGHASVPKVAPAHSSGSTTSGRIWTTSGSSRASGVSGSGGGSGVSSSASSSAHRVSASAQGGSYAVGAVPMPMMAMAGRNYSSENSIMGEIVTADESLFGKTTLGGKKDGSGPGTPGTPGNPDVPPIPVGHTPWLLMLLFATGYTLFLTKKSHQA